MVFAIPFANGNRENNIQQFLSSQYNLLVDDFRRAATIYGSVVEVLKGEGTRVKPQHILGTVKTVLPLYILTEHKDTTLTADFLAVNGNFFLH